MASFADTLAAIRNSSATSNFTAPGTAPTTFANEAGPFLNPGPNQPSGDARPAAFEPAPAASSAPSSLTFSPDNSPSNFAAAPAGSGFASGLPASLLPTDTRPSEGSLGVNLPFSQAAAVNLGVSPDLPASTFDPSLGIVTAGDIGSPLGATNATDPALGSPDSTGTGTATDPSTDPSGAAAQTGSGTAASGASWFNWFQTTTVDLLVRAGVIVLGLILLGIAAYQFAKEKETA